MTNLGGRIAEVSEDEEEDFHDSVLQVGGTVRKREPSECQVDKSPAPDDWIDFYVEERERPSNRERGYKSAVTVKLEVYTGRALEWSLRIGMWHALVHSTCKTPTEKLAFF